MYPKKLTKSVICEKDKPIAVTKEGKIRGLIVEDNYIFRGVQYAEANRYEIAHPVEPWEGIKDTIVFGPVCPEIRTGIAIDNDYVPHMNYIQDEKCHYLNIWSKHLHDGAKRPVMLWIHGGGFETGSSVEIFNYDGEELAKFGDVVVVSLNHRLNCLGFLDLSAYGEKYIHTPNLGMLDIVEALRWINRNIEVFGGDPENVTVMGQSGGGGKVNTLLQMPSADGLFHKAIIQSGLFKSRGNHLQKDSRALAAEVINQLGLNAENVEEIENVPFYKLRRAVAKAVDICGAKGINAGWGPIYDGIDYMGDPQTECGFRKETINIPVLTGSNLGEFNGNAMLMSDKGNPLLWSKEYTDELIKAQYGDKGEAIKAAFKKAYPDHPEAECMMVDTLFRDGVVAYTEKRAKAGGPTYAYMFSLDQPYLGCSTAWHNCEEAYMFRNVQYVESSYVPGVTDVMAEKLSTVWVKFAYTGDPNCELVPEWKPLDAEHDYTMKFDTVTELVDAHDRELLEILPRAGLADIFRATEVPGGGPRQSL